MGNSTFWVNWVAFQRIEPWDKEKLGAYVLGYFECSLTLEDAIKGAMFKEAQEDTILVWIEEHDSAGKKIGVPYIKPLVDAFGYRRNYKEAENGERN